MTRWTEGSVPGQEGRTAVITGGNTGLGFEAARVLAQAGAAIVLACRDPARGAAAAARIRATAPRAQVDLVRLDLASLASVREAADQLRASFAAIDLLINNAGGVNPRYQRTEDGFERTLATNHLGPFALTGLVLDRLLPVPGGDYYGPPGRAQFTSHPVRVDSSAGSHDTAAGRRLWEESERLTGVTYPIGAVRLSRG